MAFAPSFIDELVAKNPIEDVVGQYVNLRRSGGNLFGLCPFHGEKTASFSVAPDKGIYYCFGCHKGGGVINFVMDIENLSYLDAVRSLAKRAGMEVPEDEQYQNRYKEQERLWALNKEAARYYHGVLYSKAGEAGLQYALKRGFDKVTLTRFGIGFAPQGWSNLIDAMKKKGYTDDELRKAGLVSEKDNRMYDRFRNRLMFPIIDVRGNVIGFGGRVMDDSTPKYLNSPETVIFNKRKNLFALNLAKKTKLEYLILVEGYMDAIALHQYGFDCAVASLGTSLTPEHASLLTRYTDQVVLIYDGDEAGQNATKRAIPILENVGLQVKVLKMRDAKDPDEFLKKFGADRFKVLLEESSNRVEYQLNAIQKNYDLTEDDQRIKYIQAAADLISSLPGEVQREVYGNRVAAIGKITAEAMKLEVKKAYSRRKEQEKRKQQKVELAPATQLQPKSKEIRYENMKSAMAEEMVLAIVLRAPELIRTIPNLKPSNFSCELLGRVYAQILTREQNGLDVSISVLEGLSSDEASHITGFVQRLTASANENALTDCANTIISESQLKAMSGTDDLMALRQKLKERKGINS